MKKSTRVKRSRQKKSSLPKQFAQALHVGRMSGGVALVIVMVCLSAAAMLSAALRSGEVAENPSPTATPRAIARQTTARTTPARTTPARTTPDATLADARPAAPAKQAVDAKAAPITITGCLERNDETFRLRNASGAQAPKSRSWKSGFLKKGATTIEVVDAGNRLALPNHVGRRVAVTGTLVDHEMQVRSLQRVAASCEQKA